MKVQEIIDRLAEEAVLLEPNNLPACASMLKLAESINESSVGKEKEQLIENLEKMIMNDLDGEAPGVEIVVDIVERMQNIIRGDSIKDVDADQPEKTTESSAEIPLKTEDVSDKEDKTVKSADNVQENNDVTAEITDDMKPELIEEKPSKAGETPAPQSIDTTIKVTEDIDLMIDFISEAKEHLDSIEINMVNWEKYPQDKEIINSIFRPFHTIKGVAGFLNLTAINRLSHQLESLLDEAREGRIELNPELSDLIFNGVDTLKSMIETTEEAVQTGEAQEYKVDIDTLLRKILVVLNAVQMQSEVGDEIESPPTEPIGEILVKEGKVKKDDLDELLEKQKSQEPHRPIGEILINEKKATPRDISSAIRKQKESAAPQAEKHIKVDTVKMDQLLDLVGELVIAQSMVTHNPEVEKITNQRFVRDISQLMRITSNLQNVSMSMRLVPIGATFQKMNRIVRDLSSKSGKKINLILEGQSAEIDRNMVEELYDPLLHMIRNSCDHGIKTPEERLAQGKPAEGTVTLKAEHIGGKILITIADDGEGLDREAILKKAVEKGIVSPDERPDDKTIDNLIFMPGFSTAKKVTDVSGRGVGMDVVKKAIEKLHGTAEIICHPGKGTIFTINLPLTTAIIDGMLVQLGSERYIIPTLSVRQLVHPRKSDMNTIVGRGNTVKVRERILPMIKLREVLKHDEPEDDTENSVLVIIEDNDEVVALQVDSVIGKQEVVIKNIDSSSEKMEGVAGGAILGDGRVGLILDIRSIVSTDGVMAMRA